MHPIQRFIRAALVILVFSFCNATASAQSAEQEPYIQIKYRTLGWGLQTSLKTATSKDPIDVMNAQFSAQKSYTGPPVIRFYKSGMSTVDGWASPDSSTEAEESPTAEKSAKNKTAQLPATPLVEVAIPLGLTDVLFIFLPPSPGSKYPLGVVAIDDSTARTDTRNVHFYNLSPIELVVKTFDEIKVVPARQQRLWQLEPDEDSSSIAIAVTDPEAVVIYRTRYRIRDGQRIIFFAREKPSKLEDGTPQLHVTTLIDKIYSELSVQSSEVSIEANQIE